MKNDLSQPGDFNDEEASEILWQRFKGWFSKPKEAFLPTHTDGEVLPLTDATDDEIGSSDHERNPSFLMMYS